MHSSLLILATALVVWTGCSRAPVVPITNRSTNALANVVVSGSGFTNRIAQLAPGAEITMTGILTDPKFQAAIRALERAHADRLPAKKVARLNLGPVNRFHGAFTFVITNR